MVRPDWFRWVWMAFCVALWWAAAELSGHRSANPVVFGRWSVAWFVLFALTAGAATAASAGLAPQAYPRFRSARGALALSALLTGALTLGALEALFRMDFLGASYHEETARYLRETLPDAELSYRHRPGFRTVYQGRAVNFNELGLRDRPLGPRKPGETRVVILGDSVVFGWGVSEEDTFGRQLERRLEDGVPGTVRTVNTGVCSYNTLQQLRFLRRHGSRLDPDIVLLVYVENDVQPFIPVERSGSMLAVRERPGRFAGWLVARSWAYRVGYHLSRPFLAAETLEPASAGYGESMAALGELARTSEELGAGFAVLVYRMSRRPASDRLASDIAAAGREAGFAVADAAPWFEGRDLLALTNSVTDTHPNANGHAVLAAAASDFLLQNRLLTR